MAEEPTVAGEPTVADLQATIAMLQAALTARDQDPSPDPTPDQDQGAARPLLGRLSLVCGHTAAVEWAGVATHHHCKTCDITVRVSSAATLGG